MNAINVAVRTRAANVDRFIIDADDAGYLINASDGQDVSLNLHPTDLRGYERAGDDLYILLADGRVIVLDGYFASEDGSLFLSTQGVLSEVSFTDGDGSAVFAQYTDATGFGKWSPDDRLVFAERAEIIAADYGVVEEDSSVSMLAAGLLAGGGGLSWLAGGAAVATGAAAVASDGDGGSDDDGDGDGGDGGDGGPRLVGSTGDSGSVAAPTVDDGSYRLGGDGLTEAERSIPITGTAQPGDVVTVEIGTKTGTTTTQSDGTWQVVFDGPDFPADGAYVTAVTVVGAAGQTDLTGPSVVIDTTPPPLEITSGTTATGEVISAAEFNAGARVTGTTEPGAQVVVIAGGVSHVADVDAQGGWGVTLNSAALAQGEYVEPIRVVAIDGFNNSASVSDGIEIDTLSAVTLSSATVESDGVINADERSDGVEITGTTDIGSSVTVEQNGIRRAASVDQQGNWSVQFAAGEIPQGEQNLTLTATSTDAVGNTSTASGQVAVDTIVRNFGVGANPVTPDNVVNDTEHTQGVTLTGTTEPGARVTVTLEGVGRLATVDASGNWTAQFSSFELPKGTYSTTAQISTEDQAGNTASTTQTFQVDTEVVPLTLTTAPGGTDGIVGAAEAAQGVTLAGAVEPGATVDVVIDGQRIAAQVTGTTWSVTLPAGALPAVDGQSVPVQIIATDAAGNTATVTDAFVVDTIAPDAPDMTAITHDQSQTVRGIVLANSGDDIVIERVDGGGLQSVGFTDQDRPSTGETWYDFTQLVPDGSHLVITANDTGGNSTSTYVVLDDPNTSQSTVAVSGNLGGQALSVIDLEFTEQATLTLSEAQIVALTDQDNTVRVLGNPDETVNLAGATRTGTRVEDGTTFNMYELGDATVLIDDDITSVTI